MKLKKQKLILIALSLVAASALLGSDSVPSQARSGSSLSEGMELNIFTGMAGSIPGTHVDASLNEYDADQEVSYIGGIPLFHAIPGCEYDVNTDPYLWCFAFFIGYCSEADVDAQIFGNTIQKATIDARLNYLTWRYDYDWFLNNLNTGRTGSTMAAVQALTWAWMSDPSTGSAVFAGQNPYDWNGLVPSAHTDPAPRVGFHTDVLHDDPYAFRAGFDDADILANATQSVYDLAVEANAKAGPWVLVQTGTGDGVALYAQGFGNSGVSPLAGEPVVFDDGTTVVTDSAGVALWPDGATSATIESPGQSWFTPGPADGGQDMILTTGQQQSVTRTVVPTTTVPPTTTLPPTTTTPPTTAPPTTAPPTTEPPVTEPPATDPPVTEPPITQPPVTEPPGTTTEPPQTTTTTTVPETTTTTTTTTTVPETTTTTTTTTVPATTVPPAAPLPPTQAPPAPVAQVMPKYTG